jgi:Cu/Ag efflux protein CusF
MKTFALLALIAALTACAKTETTTTQTEATTTTAPATTAPAAVKTYPMNGVIVSRDPAKNTVNIDNEDVPGVMAPMKMDYELRGATVDSLPPDGTKVTMTLHDQNGTYWVSDVKPRQ